MNNGCKVDPHSRQHRSCVIRLCLSTNNVSIDNESEDGMLVQDLESDFRPKEEQEMLPLETIPVSESREDS